MASKAVGKTVTKSLKIIVVFTAILSLTGCDKVIDIIKRDKFLNFLAEKFATESDVASDPEVIAENPCVKPWVIQGIKDNIIEKARDGTIKAYGFDPANDELVGRSDITIDNISAASARDDGRVNCKAQVNITYHGNAQTETDLSAQLVQLLNNDYFSELLASFGIDTSAIASLSNLRGNSFSAFIDYDVGTAYNEAGTAEENYYVYGIAAPAAMLSAMVEFDKQLQDDSGMMAYDDVDIGSAEAAATAMAEAENAVAQAQWEQEQRLAAREPLPEPKAPKGSGGLSSIRIRDYEEDTVVVEEPAVDDSYDYETVEVYEEDYAY